MYITKELLKEKKACVNGVSWFSQNFPEGCTLDDMVQSDKMRQCPTEYIWWFYNRVQQDVRLYAFCAVNGSVGVNKSHGVNGSGGVNRSDGANRSNGVNKSHGVNKSFGCMECHGIDRCLFCFRATGQRLIFNIPVDEARFEMVRSAIYKLLGNWQPIFNNIKALYLKSGSDWTLTPVADAKGISIKEAWAGMPQEQ